MPALIDYENVKANIVQWVRDVAGEFLYGGLDGEGAVWWVEDAHPYQVTPYCELTWNDGGIVGEDATVWRATGGDDDTLTPRTIGNRQMILSVEFRSRGDVNAPRAAAEALRAAFKNELWATRLRTEYGLSPVRIEGYQAGGGFVWEGRLEAVSSLELRFGYQVVADASITVERIRNVEYAGTVTGTDGNPAGADLEDTVGLDYPIT